MKVILNKFCCVLTRSKMLVTSAGSTVEWMRIILLHKWSEVIGIQHHRQHSRQKPAWWVSVSCCSWCFRQADKSRQLLKASLKGWKAHTQVALTYTHQQRLVPQHIQGWVDGSSALTNASQREASVGQCWPVSVCVSLWALSRAQWELCTAHITLYMQSVWVLLSRERYIAMNWVFTPWPLQKVTNDNTNEKTTAQRQHTYWPMHIAQNRKISTYPL